MAYWSRMDEFELIDMYQVRGYSATEISVILGRSVNAIKLKIKRLKLKHDPEQTKKTKSRCVSGDLNPKRKLTKSK